MHVRRHPPLIARLGLAVLACLIVAPAAARAEDPADFSRELSLLRRYVACDDRVEPASPPAGIKARSVDGACKEVKRRVDIFRKRWLDKARDFLAGIVPSDLPPRVVYPFGGADLLHALAVFPDAERITTLSLEWVGDPRAIGTMDAPALLKNMKQQHAFLIKLFQVNHNRTIDLQELNHSPVPAPLVFALSALHLYGYEPIEARWFNLDDDGRVVWLTPSAITAFDATPAAKKQKDRNEFFSNVELSFRKAGDPNAKVQVWRHLRANLNDDQFKGSPVEKLIAAEAPFASMMKAASYLIWRDDFGGIRDALLSGMTWMISETSGIAPYHAAEKGFVQDVWGRFTGNLFAGAKKGENAMIELFASRPEKALPFQFGYPDKAEHNHLIVTRRE
jgi:hypothetical protein